MGHRDTAAKQEQTTTSPTLDPPSPPLRDDGIDNNRSPSRKRPRLDSGSLEVRNESADCAMTGNDKAGRSASPVDSKMKDDSRASTPGRQHENITAQPHTPNRVTINLREPKTENQIAQQGGKSPRCQRSPRASDLAVLESGSSNSSSSKSSASPVIQILDENEDDREETVAEVRLTDDEDVIARIFDCFPGSAGNGYDLAAEKMLLLLDKGLNFKLLDNLSAWIGKLCSTLERDNNCWVQAFYDHASFWETILKIYRTLLNRSVGKNHEGLSIDEIGKFTHNILRNFATLLSRMIETDSAFLEDDNIEIERSALLSSKFILAARGLFREDRGFIAKVLPGFDIQSPSILPSFVRVFVQEDGARYLAKMVSGILRDQRKDDTFATRLVGCVSLATSLGQCLGMYENPPDSTPNSTSKQLVKQLQKIFKTVSEQLFASLDKQQDILSIEVRKPLVGEVDLLLSAILVLSPENQHDYLESMTGLRGIPNGLEDTLPMLGTAVWKIKLLMAYIRRGRMELRIVGILALSELLINYYNAVRPSKAELRVAEPAPLLSFLADILVEEKILDFLVGPGSHQVLISKSQNVIGFLVVSNQFTRERVELIWSAILESQDPRIVEADFGLLKGLVEQLMNFPENLMVCDVIMSRPMPPLTPPAAEFLTGLLTQVRTQCYEWDRTEGGRKDEHYRVLLKFSIQVLCSLHQSKLAGPHARPVCDAAAELVILLAPMVQDAVREEMYGACMQMIRDSINNGAAASQALYLMLKQAQPSPKVIAKELGLIPVLLEDWCNFVHAQRVNGATPSMAHLTNQLCPRLDLIWYTAPADHDIDEKLLRRFWSHLVGAEAISHNARDVAWQRLSIIAFYPGAENSFLEVHEELLSPTEIAPEHYTVGFFAFIQKLATSKIRRQSVPELAENGAIEIPGLDLLCNILLMAPAGVNDDNMIQFMCATYLDKTWLLRVSKDAVEATHKALVDECVQRLKQAHQKVRSLIKGNGASEDKMLLDKTPVDNSEPDLIFLRTVKFLHKCLLHIRSRHDFQSEEAKSKPSAPKFETPDIRGDPVTIKCEIMRPGQRMETRNFHLGHQNTCRQLHRCVGAVLAEYNIASFQLISIGKRMQLLERPRMTLEDTGIARTPHIILREGSVNDDARREYIIPEAQWRSAFEERLVEKLDILYDFLDKDDAVSHAAFELLKNLPRHEPIKKLVSEARVHADQIFSADQPLKISYSLDCLREELESRASDVDFIQHGARLIEALMPTEELLTRPNGADAVYLSDAIATLFDFVIASKGQEVSLFVDPGSLMRKVLLICRLAVAPATPKAYGPIWDCYELAIDLVASSEEAWEEFSCNEQVPHIYEHLLFDTPDLIARRNAYQLIRRKMDTFPANPLERLPKFLTFLWHIIAGMIPEAVETPDRALETFSMAKYLLERLVESKCVAAAFLDEHFKNWCSLLCAHTYTSRVGRDEVDNVLEGLATLLRLSVEAQSPKMVSSSRIQFIDHVWWRFLFQKPLEYQEEPKLHADEVPVLETSTRTQLVLLLNALCNDDACLAKICELALKINIEHKWAAQVDRSVMTRSSAGAVGLRNLGNTCYMNSLMTQLFMNPVFRAFVLGSSIATDDDSAPLLLETQKLFAEMQNSYERSVSASDFTDKIVLASGDQIDRREQMDVDEFMNSLFEQWEKEVPTQALKEKLKSIYSCKTVQQISSQECQHVSEREDPCLALQCDVQGKPNLEESLKAFTEGEPMQGDNKYRCEPCGKLVDAVKRTCLKHLPDHMMLQLKRFNYDMTTFRRYKINDYFAFPMTIDMAPFTYQHLSNPGISQEGDFFDLVGIIVHKGSADHGHYVSYIRDRPIDEGQQPTWRLFDDADVSVFDPKDLAEACFGGPASKDSGTFYPSSEKIYNAYMLFYQRRSSLQEQPWRGSGSVSDIQRVPVPSHLEDNISIDNRILLKDYCLFDESSREFIRSLLGKLEQMGHESPQHELENATISILWSYFASIWARTRELPDIEPFFDRFKAVCENCTMCAFLSLKWLIESRAESRAQAEEKDILRDLIMKTNQPRIRGMMRMFVLEAMRTVRLERDMYGVDVEAKEPIWKGKGALAMITRLAQFACQSLHYNLRSWEDYFGLLADLAELGPQESFTMVRDGLLTVGFEIPILSSTTTPGAQRTHIKVAEALKRRLSPSYTQLIRLTAILLSYVDMNADTIPDEDADRRLDYHDARGLPLTDLEEQILMQFDSKEGGLTWLCEIVQKWDYDVEPFYPGKIVRLCCAAKAPLRLGVLETFRTGIKDYESSYADNFLRTTPALLLSLRERAKIEDLVKFMRAVSMEANPKPASRTDEGYNGLFCFNFWQCLARMIHGTLSGVVTDRSFLDTLFTDALAYWAPSLLLYTRDFEVGRLAQRLIKESVFDSASELADEAIRGRGDHEDAVRALFWGCEKLIGQYRSFQEQPWRQFAVPLHSIMSLCVESARAYMSKESEEGKMDDVDLFNIAIVNKWEDDIRGWFEALPSHAVDDLEPAQSSELAAGWENLGIGEDTFAEQSDLTEVSEEDFREMLPADVDAAEPAG